MIVETGKLYLVTDSSTVTNERPIILEKNGTVDFMIYGTNKDESLISSISDMSPQLTENLTGDVSATLSGLPKYVAFIGTADYIYVQDRILDYVKDIS